MGKRINDLYVNYNANPNGKKTSDCVVRSFSKALGISWEEVYKELCDIGLEIKAMPDDVAAFGIFADRHGMIKRSMGKVEKGSKRMTLNEFCINKPVDKKYVASLANHLVAVVDGRFHDIWDCGDKVVYIYWEI